MPEWSSLLPLLSKSSFGAGALHRLPWESMFCFVLFCLTGISFTTIGQGSLSSTFGQKRREFLGDFFCPYPQIWCALKPKVRVMGKKTKQETQGCIGYSLSFNFSEISLQLFTFQTSRCLHVFGLEFLVGLNKCEK